MNDKLIDGALDFIERASAEVDADELVAERQLKYSTLHLYLGVELMLKARLVQEHWSLVVRDPESCDRQRFERGDFQSVDFARLVDRLRRVCDAPLSSDVVRSFDRLRQLRNRIAHFVCSESRESVVAAQLSSWHYLLELLEQRYLGELTPDQSASVEGIREAMMARDRFLATRLDTVASTISELRRNGCLVIECPRCRKRALVCGQGEGPLCYVCRAGEEDSYAITLDYAVGVEPWRFDRKGLWEDIPWCESCENHTVTPADPELAEQLENEIEDTRTEPGDDRTVFVCLTCGEAFDDQQLRACVRCNDLFAGSDQTSYCPLCETFS